ncbi:hypothetical protein GCM10011348_38180 [Marinobacterium nitratireducens]|uniref:Uncharacterized protein n=1 Tax=Marinobacterium nitratireducens TaxID=518897 RepID=A0A917ZPM5_9GAMM|nr:hypothetical protein GCM10011348_38180 [Marinobacterium nitratireducens]
MASAVPTLSNVLENCFIAVFPVRLLFLGDIFCLFVIAAYVYPYCGIKSIVDSDAAARAPFGCSGKSEAISAPTVIGGIFAISGETAAAVTGNTVPTGDSIVLRRGLV